MMGSCGWSAGGSNNSTREGDGERTKQRMSFDFLAPSNEAAQRESMLRQSGGQIQSLHDRAFMPSPSMQEERNGYEQWGRTSEGSSPYQSETDIFAERATISSLSVSKQMSHRRREDDRHNYDNEEKYAILFFRIEREEKWSDVQKHIHLLFPPGTPRRQAGKGLTKHYVERRKGGLECRYYRLREDFNLKALRSAEYDSSDDRGALRQLQGALELSSEFLGRLREL